MYMTSLELSFSTHFTSKFFYLDNNRPLPALQPQAHFTYSKDEDMHDILRDIRANLGAAADLEALSLYIRPPPAPPLPVNAMDLDEESSEEEHATGDDSIGSPAGAVTAAEDAGATLDPVVPPHPDAGPIDALQDHLVLPPDLQAQLQIQLNCTLDPIIQFYEAQGITPEGALNEARSRAWAHLREMTAVAFRDTKRSRQVAPSGSSSSTGQV